MASPISVGDAYLIGMLAYQLGKAFTKGRKSAPAEFREVENQLYSLSTALSALRHAHGAGRLEISVDPSDFPNIQNDDIEDPISTMLKSCRQTLQHLELIVKKYGIINENQLSDKNQPLLKRWSKELRANWKKIEWTTTGGNLATLRSQLTIHTNSLNLILGLANNIQGKRLENRMIEIMDMLREINEWFVRNMETPVAFDQQPIASSSSSSSASSRDSYSGFHLYSGSHDDMTLICDHAWLHPEWNFNRSGSLSGDMTGPGHLFVCHCNEVGLHDAHMADFKLSPNSYPIRLAGKERSWMLDKVTKRTNNLLVPLFIKKVPIRDFSEFEDTFIDGLAFAKSKELFRMRGNTMLAYHSTSQNEAQILRTKADATFVKNNLEEVTVSIRSRFHTISKIKAVHILNYNAIRNQAQNNDIPNRTIIAPLGVAEIFITYEITTDTEGITPNDIAKTLVISLEAKTKIEIPKSEDNEAKVLVHSVQFSSGRVNSPSSNAARSDISFRFNNLEAAKRFENRLQEMRLELLIISLQYPRKDEKVLLTLQTNEVHSNDIYITDAEIKIVENTTKKCLRLIIVSRNGCSVLSQEFPKESLLSNAADIMSTFRSPTFWVQMDSNGIRQVFSYPNGLSYLRFGNVQSDNLFQLGLAALSGNQEVHLLENASEELPGMS